ncbi:MAG: AhpC/TSA family protein [Prevotellaceae bacterium]|jgi:thiol-disulfide isomerase/thioredoxin|nr:AhpC/TSA family protein [Prevotellaceae bacterium]
MQRIIHLFACTAVALCLTICTSTSDKLVIKGNLTGLQPGDTIVVFIYDFEQKRMSGDTVGVTQKGRFYLERKLDKAPYTAYLYYFPADTTLRPLSKTLDFLSASDKLTLWGAAADFPTAQADGGFYSDKAVKAYAHRVDSINNILNLVSDSLSDAEQRQDAPEAARIDAALLQLATLLDDEKTAFIRNNPSVMYSAYLYTSTSRWATLKKVQEQYEAFSPELQQSLFGEMIKKNIDRRAAVAAGAQLPDFTVTDVNGKSISAADFKGRYLLLDFWGSWCSWCRKASPTLVKLYDEYKSKNFCIVGLAWDSNHESWKKAIALDGLAWEHANLYDHQAVKDLFCISAFPTYIFVSPEGAILANSSDFDAEIEPIIRETLK